MAAQESKRRMFNPLTWGDVGSTASLAANDLHSGFVQPAAEDLGTLNNFMQRLSSPALRQALASQADLRKARYHAAAGLNTWNKPSLWKMPPVNQAAIDKFYADQDAVKRPRGQIANWSNHPELVEAPTPPTPIPNPMEASGQAPTQDLPTKAPLPAVPAKIPDSWIPNDDPAKQQEPVQIAGNQKAAAALQPSGGLQMASLQPTRPFRFQGFNPLRSSGGLSDLSKANPFQNQNSPAPMPSSWGEESTNPAPPIESWGTNLWRQAPRPVGPRLQGTPTGPRLVMEQPTTAIPSAPPVAAPAAAPATPAMPAMQEQPAPQPVAPPAAAPISDDWRDAVAAKNREFAANAAAQAAQQPPAPAAAPEPAPTAPLPKDWTQQPPAPVTQPVAAPAPVAAQPAAPVAPAQPAAPTAPPAPQGRNIHLAPNEAPPPGYEWTGWSGGQKVYAPLDDVYGGAAKPNMTREQVRDQWSMARQREQNQRMAEEKRLATQEAARQQLATLRGPASNPDFYRQQQQLMDVIDDRPRDSWGRPMDAETVARVNKIKADGEVIRAANAITKDLTDRTIARYGSVEKAPAGVQWGYIDPDTGANIAHLTQSQDSLNREIANAPMAIPVADPSLQLASR